jgi:nucleolar GTP-binding protein
MDVDGVSKGQLKRQKKEKVESKRREASMTRSHTKAVVPSQKGLRDETASRITQRLEKIGRMSWSGSRASGEGDQRKTVHLVKWYNTGKKRMGTHYQR